jgi:hypothetical protein
VAIFGLGLAYPLDELEGNGVSGVGGYLIGGEGETVAANLDNVIRSQRHRGEEKKRSTSSLHSVIMKRRKGKSLRLLENKEEYAAGEEDEEEEIGEKPRSVKRQLYTPLVALFAKG